MKRRFRKILTLIFAVGCVAICVLIASAFSSALTVSGVAGNTTTTAGYSQYTIYAVSVGTYTSKTQAESLCIDIQQKNGGGFVYKQNETYNILVSAYEKENDAKLVVENLSKSGTSATVVELKFEKVEFEQISSSAQKKQFCEVLDQFRIAFIGLYDVSVSLDTSVIDNTKAKISVIEIRTQLEEVLEKTSKGESSIDGIYYQMLKEKIEKTEDLLNDIKNYEEIEGILLSAKIKNTYLQILDLTQDLISLLNNEI